MNWSVPVAFTVADAAVTATDVEVGVGCGDEFFDELPPQAMSDRLRRAAATTVIALVRTVVSPHVRLCELLK